MGRSNHWLISLTVCLAIASLTCVADAQQEKKAKKPSFNVKKFLQRLDVNQNGKVDPSEIKDDRTRNFLKNAGVDPSKPISIKGFSKQIKAKRDERANPSSAQQSKGFAVQDEERDEEIGEGRRFAVSDEEREPTSKASAREFSPGAKKMLDWVLKNYDKNNDGKIDKNEIKAGRWSDPPAEESDTNKDGSLSKMELLIRYQAREDRKSKKDSERESRRSRRSRDRDRERSSPDRSRSSRQSSNSNSSQSSKASRDVRKGYENYVDGIFKSYDKDKDGMLDESEVKGMRRPLDKKIDSNGDKKISKSELVESYMEKAGHGSSKKQGSSRNRNRASSRAGSSSSRGSSSSSSARTGAREPLTGKDGNKNGQIEMAEYTKVWTVEMLKEFRKIDKNNDRVITKEEWDNK